MNIVRQVQGWLQETKLPYALEQGKRHIKVRLGDRFVAAIPLKGTGSETNRRAALNTRAQIRRAAKEIHAERGTELPA